MKSRILLAGLKGWVILVLSGFSAALFFLLVSPDAGYVLAPIAATLFIALLFWWALSRRRGEIPLAEPGIIAVLAMVCYAIIPSLQFLLSGMEHTILSAYQLYVLAPTAQEFGAFTWWYVVYLLSFVIGYLVFDPKKRTPAFIPRFPGHATNGILLLVFGILSAIMFAIEAMYEINLYGVYDIERMYETYETYLQMPVLFRQLYGIIGHNGILLIVKLGLLLTIFLNWKKRAYRYALYAWLIVMLVSNVLWMGARTELVLTFVACAIMYHRFVKPLRVRQILPAAITVFVGFMIIGVMRGAANIGANVENLKDIFGSAETIFSTNTEFQALFGGNYDLLLMRKGGLLGEIPVQFVLYDLVMIIPQQILPFEKLDVQQWVVNRSLNPGFFMFNPISQSIIGFGWVELIFRGLFLGLVLARVRAWYIKRTSSFWPTLLYFYLIIISYYTIRGTAIYVLLASILFRFIPVYFLILFVTKCGRVATPRVSVASRIVFRGKSCLL